MLLLLLLLYKRSFSPIKCSTLFVHIKIFYSVSHVRRISYMYPDHIENIMKTYNNRYETSSYTSFLCLYITFFFSFILRLFRHEQWGVVVYLFQIDITIFWLSIHFHERRILFLTNLCYCLIFWCKEFSSSINFTRFHKKS